MMLTWCTCLPSVPLVPLVTLTPVPPGLPLVHTAGHLVTVLLPPALVLTTGHRGTEGGQWGPQPRPL